MKLIRIGAAALNQTPMDWRRNAENIRQAIAEAKARGIMLLCLPELCITGYGCEDAFFAPSTRRTARKVLMELLPETKGLTVTMGLPVMHRGSLFNASVLIADGKIQGIVTKQNLAGDGLHYEPRWFKPWPRGVVTELNFEGVMVPAGDIVFELGRGLRIGFEICEDAWVAHRPGPYLADRGVDIILNPSASHFAFGKQDIRRRLVTDSSRAFGATYIYSNLLGNEAGRVIYDGALLIGSGGDLLRQGPRFSFQSYMLIDAQVDVDATRLLRAQSVSHTPPLTPDTSIVNIQWSPPREAPAKETVSTCPWEQSEHIEEEEFARAIALGLYDYARKSHSRGFVVSLSGGADSSAVVALIWLMVQLGVRELGSADFWKRLGVTSPSAKQIPSIADILTTLYQGTTNSSATTKGAAQVVASAIGAKHLELEVSEIVTAYTTRIEAALDRKLTWENDDLALQNIQARVRAPSAWLIANLQHALLLSTSNRSEAAVGYATMDGDTSGGISPIAGIDKAFLRRWLHWLETEGPNGSLQLSALKAVNSLKPTAELRPISQEQSDESDLMPYEVLDAIEHEAIGEKRSPAETLAQVTIQFPQYSQEQLKEWNHRFFTLWSRNQWKRERYAPSFHVDDRNLDPKTWCRWPILSGGFEQELQAIRNDGSDQASGSGATSIDWDD